MKYKQSGVNIDAGNEVVENIKGLTTGIGSFAAISELPKLNDPVMVTCNDGVGTKVRLANTDQDYYNIGFDCVAMCVNDMVCHGAQPHSFLDYYATSPLVPKNATQVIRGIADACKSVGCNLVGGETAELPNVIVNGGFDVAGFCVGFAERNDVITGSRIKSGDAIIGLASSGLHSNGFSLINYLIETEKLLPTPDLLTPTRLYVNPILELHEKIGLNGIANITGGGLQENIPRIVPKHLHARIDVDTWQVPEIFRRIQNAADIDDAELLRVFNCGIGITIILNESNVEYAYQILARHNMNAWTIGTIVEVD
jgi:phosphoribosylformylglycinamidine cyclo-ligase